MALPAGAPAPSAPPTNRVSLALTGLAVLCLASYFVLYLWYARALLAFPFDYDQGEGFELYDTVLLSQGQSPYRDNALYPFYASNYPPLYHVLILPLVPFTGATYFAGRLIAFWGTLLTGATLAGIVRRETRRRGLHGYLAWCLPALTAFAWYASNYVYHIGPLLRQHMLMILFEALAVTFAAQAHGPRTRRALVAAGLCLLAAGFTKQLAIGTACAVGAYLFLRGPRRALAWGALTAGIGLALFAALDVLTAHQWYLNTISANINEFHLDQTISLYQQWFRLHGALIVPALALVLYELYADRLSVYSIWLVAAIGIGGLSGKWGAGESYFVTAVTATCICAALAFTRLHQATLTRPRATRAVGLLIPACYLLYAAQVLHYPTDFPPARALANALGLPTTDPYYDSVGYTQLGRPPTADDIRGGQMIVAHLLASPKPALSEDAGFSLYAGKPVIGNPTQLLNLWKNGLLDSRALETLVRAQAFSVVVFRAQFYPPPVLDAIYSAYRPCFAIKMNGFEYTLMYPRPKGDEPCPPPPPNGISRVRPAHAVAPLD